MFVRQAARIKPFSIYHFPVSIFHFGGNVSAQLTVGSFQLEMKNGNWKMIYGKWFYYWTLTSTQQSCRLAACSTLRLRSSLDYGLDLSRELFHPGPCGQAHCAIREANPVTGVKHQNVLTMTTASE